MNYLFSPGAVRVWILVGSALFAIFFIAFIYAVVRYRKNISREEDFQRTGPLLNAESVALSAFQNTIRDLKEEQKKLEQKARDSAERARSAETTLRSLVENIQMPVLVMNKVGLVQIANGSARTLFGTSSLTAYGVEDLFRSASISLEQDGELAQVCVPEMLREALRGSEPLRDVRVVNEARGGQAQVLDITVLPHPESSLLLLTVVPGGVCTDVVPPASEKLSEDDTEQR